MEVVLWIHEKGTRQVIRALMRLVSNVFVHSNTNCDQQINQQIN
jgi:hypothetical protein